MGVSKNRGGPFFGSPCNEDHNILGSILGPRLFGDYHIGSIYGSRWSILYDTVYVMWYIVYGIEYMVYGISFEVRGSCIGSLYGVYYMVYIVWCRVYVLQ